MRVRATLASLVCAALCASGCRDEQSQAGEPETSAQPEKEPTKQASKPVERLSVLELLDTCDVSHRGHTLDIGSLAAETQRSFSQMFEEDVQLLPHGGGSFAEITSRSVDYQFWLTEPLEALHVSARVRGRRSGRMAVYVDGKRLGSARLRPGESQVVSFSLTKKPLEPGRHTLGVRLSRGDRHSKDAYAELEWLHLSAPEPADDQYAAPTQKDIVTDVVLQKRPRRAIALREQSAVRCPIWPAADTRLKLWLGFWGKGAGRAEIRVHREGEVPITLEQRELEGGETAGWTPLNLPLGRFAGELIGIEFGVRQASGVGRVAFGDPALVRASQSALEVPRSPTVLLVVMGGLRRATLPPWGSTAKLPGFGALVRMGTAFTNYRAPSTVPAAALASILTGLEPRSHVVEDPSARLSDQITTVHQALKQSSGQTAMFTGVPTSFPAFGFAQGWDEHQADSPVVDEPAHAPFDRAAVWLKASVERVPEARRLILIHARGAHPPWDVPKAEAANLKPEEYNGAIDTRRGGIALANIRARRRRASRRLDSDDWTRLRALESVALKKQDAAFTRLTKTLDELGLWDEALVMVVGDVGAGEPPVVPYHPAGDLTEARLFVPLIVKFPGRRLSGKETSVPATAVDLAATMWATLGLEPPPQATGADLFALASGQLPLAGRPLWASRGPEFATQLGPWRLSGTLGKVPRLCQMAVDPACVNDVFESKPFTANSLWKWTYLAEKTARAARSVSREPASIDEDTAAALAVWGDMQ